MSKGKDSKCGSCSVEVKGKEEAVSCDGCKRWFHNSCMEVNDDLYKSLTKFVSIKGQGLHWYCPTCNTSIKKVLGQMQGIFDKQRDLEKEIAQVKIDMTEKAGKSEIEEIKKLVKGLQKEVVEVKNEGSSIKIKIDDNIKHMDEEKEKMCIEVTGRKKQGGGGSRNEDDRKFDGSRRDERHLTAKISEVMDRENRKKNLIRMGMDEYVEGSNGPDDDARVRRLFLELNDGAPVRLGKIERLKGEVKAQNRDT